jgi:uncharacterized protein (TIGR03118 family)
MTLNRRWGEDSLDKVKDKAADGKPAGKVAEFDETGKLVRILDDGNRLNVPWAVTVAPSDFGPLSGKLLVGNFGGLGHVLAYDDATGKFVDYLRDADGKPVEIPGLWALMFGKAKASATPTRCTSPRVRRTRRTVCSASSG